MSESTAIFVFKLRQNIALEGDLLLAKMELDSFLPDSVQDLMEIKSIIPNIPELSEIEGLGRLDAHVRQNGKQAYVAKGSLELLPHLIRRVSFIQRIYCVTQVSPSTKAFLVDTVHQVGSIIKNQVVDNRLIIQAIPHYTLIELSKVVANHSQGVDDTKRNLDGLVDALLDRTANKSVIKLTTLALSARSTTSHLTHDIHYYKAKFFPRMVRSILNSCTPELGKGCHVLDNFVGSGTTLLEASILGIPSLGLDIDPLSTMIAQAKLDAVDMDSELLATEAARIIQAIENKIIETRFGGRCDSDEITIIFPDWLMKNRKMTEEIATELSGEINRVQSAITGSDPRLYKLLCVLMSDAISRKIRMRFMGTGVGRFSLTLAQKPLFTIFTDSLRQYVKVAAMCEWLKQRIHLRLADAQVIAADSKHLPSNLGQFDILVTSPPYLPASSGRESYAKARALSLIALGLDNVEDLIDNSIGSMNGNGIDVGALTNNERDLVEWLHRDKLRQIKAEPTGRYFLDMRQAFAEMYQVLRPGAKAVVISGKTSTFYQFKTRKPLYVVNVAEILAYEAQRVGFEVDALHDIQLDKCNRNARPRSLDNYYETLIMLQKPL
jgi:DNA modification methylase